MTTNIELLVAHTNKMLRVGHILTSITAGLLVYVLAFPLLVSGIFRGASRFFDSAEWRIRAMIDRAVDWHRKMNGNLNRFILERALLRHISEDGWSFEITPEKDHDVYILHRCFSSRIQLLVKIDDLNAANGE